MKQVDLIYLKVTFWFVIMKDMRNFRTTFRREYLSRLKKFIR